jgi:hypothetical protein
MNVKIDYAQLLFIYAPVILCILIAQLKNRFEPENIVLKSQKWTLTPAIFFMIVLLSGFFAIRSFWHYVPVFRNNENNLFSWAMTLLGLNCLIIVLIYSYLRYIYGISIINIFNLRLVQFSFILKICAVLTVMNILSIYFFDLNLLLHFVSFPVK